MDEVSLVDQNGLLGISFLYWTILSFLIALVTLFIRIPPFAMPRNPSNWILKKIILQYFHSLAWLILAWVFYRLFRHNGDLSMWLIILIVIAISLMVIFLLVWWQDRLRIRKMKENQMEK